MRFTQITFRHMAHSTSIGERIREISNALEERYPAIERCRASVEEFRTPAKAHQFKVSLDVRMKGGTLTSSAHGPDIERVLQQAFGELEAKVQERAAPPRAA